MNLTDYFNAYKNIYREIKIQRKYSKDFLVPYIEELETKFDGSFTAEQKQKIFNYYGLFITAFLCSSYKRLEGKTLSVDERKRATLFGILTPAGDDLFDTATYDISNISTITFKPETYVATSFMEKVAKEIQSYLLQHVPYKNEYIQASADVLHIQAETIKQTDAAITEKELERVTFTKGAVSVIIYHQCLDNIADEPMKDALFCVGSLFQLGNDIFDLYKDVRDDIYTLVNTCDDFNLFKEKFIARVRLQNQKIMQLSYNEKAKKEFCIVMNTINARSMVALHQFIQLQDKTKQKINWWGLQRKDMIVDMEKPLNFLKWVYYIWKLPRLI